LRTQCLVAANVSGAFITQKVLTVAKGYPWCLLAGGQIDENLEALALAPAVAEPTAAKVQDLLKAGYNRVALREAVERLGDVHWTTAVQEQGHASGAIMHRAHEFYDADVLCARSMIHMVRALVHEPPPSRAALLAGRKLASLAKKCPEKVTGRHIFLGEFMQTSKDRGNGEPLSWAQRKDIMKRHGALYDRLPLASKRAYEARAARDIEHKRHEIEGDVEHIHAARAMRSTRLDEERRLESQKCRLANCRFSPADFERMAAMWEDPQFSKQKVAELREKAMSAPVPPAAHVKQRLEAFIDAPEAQKRPVPVWCNLLCKHRAHFKLCALIFKQGATEQAFAFLYACQSPMGAAFVPLKQQDIVLPALGSANGEEIMQAMLDLYACRFVVLWGQHTFHHEIVTDGTTEVFVVPGLVSVGKNTVASHVGRVAFSDFVANLGPDKKEPNNATPSQAAPRVDTDLLTRYPWLASYIGEERQSVAGGGGSSCGATTEFEPLPPEEEEEIFAFLEAKRRAWQHEYDLPQENFRTCILGGPWVKAHTGMVAHGVKAAASGALANQWCQLYGMPSMATFAIKKYTLPVATNLALGWCRRLQFLFDIWVGQNEELYTYSHANLEALPVELAKFKGQDELEESHPAKVRWNEFLPVLPNKNI
jgi:hypothetical protein